MIQQPSVNLDYEEDVDGIRFNWNRWPASRVESEKNVLTLGCLYTPLKEPTDQRYNLQLPQAPIFCCRSTCKAILNPFCATDLQSQQKGWVCNFCSQRNPFPQQYQHISQPQQIRELLRTTIDYVQTHQPNPHPPVFLYVVDSCVDEVEFTALKTSIISSLALLPQNALVGLITFNHIVYLWELNDSQNLKSFVFCGSKDYTPKQLQEWLGLSLAPTQAHANMMQPQQPQHPVQQPYYQQNPQPPMHRPPLPANGHPGLPNHAPPTAARNITKFLKPASQIEQVLTNVLEQVGKNIWPTATGRRPLRSVGAALSVAINILETTYPNSAARIMLFLGGPCTIGPGMVIDDDLKNTIRTHHDIFKDNVTYMKKATDYYLQLATKASHNGHAIDIFSCALDQTGLHEMKHCTNMTNGLMVMGDSFESNLFKTSFQRIFAKDSKGQLKMAFNAILDVKTSRELKVSGAVGSCISMNKRTAYVADKKDGIGGTSVWKFCSLTPNSTTAFYFVVQNAPTFTHNQQGAYGFVQFITQYTGSDGYRHIRVTTCRRPFNQITPTMGQKPEFEFDQESAAVLLARMACYRTDTNEVNGQDIMKWIDKCLIRICQKFGDFQPSNPDSFRLRDDFSMFPSFLFNLRRSQFIVVFNNSPDETSFYRHSLMREDSSNSLLMIQPSLAAYEMYQETQPVSLDITSIKPDRILLMDTFFQIVIFHGEKVAIWRKQNYQDKEGYGHFKTFLECPINDANELMMSRFPLPRYVVCDQDSSQARFLLSRVNPSKTHNTSMGYYGDGSTSVLSDDVPYAEFDIHLRKLTVDPSV